MGVSKVEITTENGAETLIDLTGDTVTPETLAEGATAHGANGALIIGTAKKVNIVQGKGSSTTDVMSQDAVSAELNGLSEEIANYLPKNQGSANVGKILVVGTDGNLVLTDMPESGANGDVVGTIDENNNILLSGNLADGTYTFKYETEEGEFVEVGTLEVGVVEPSEPTYTNLLPLAVDANGNDYVGTNGEDGYKSGYKMSTSSGNESATSGAYCSGFMPITNISHKIRVKNVTLSAQAHVNNFVFYDSSKTKITATSTANGTAGAFHQSVMNEGNGVYSVTPGAFMTTTEGSDIAFFRFSCGGITDGTIVTVNEEIV